jgi:hypothetical protein
MHPFNDITGPLADRENVLAALRPAQIELVDRVEIFSGVQVEPAWKKLKKLFDGGGIHGLWEGRRLSDRHRGPRPRGPRSC